MKKNAFYKMSLAELQAHHPQNEEECETRSAEIKFKKWCKENKEDPEDEDCRERYQLIQIETGQGFWDNLDEADREGWEDKIAKDWD
jgi:hypothetical protein